MVHVLKGIARVGIDLERYVAESLTDLPDDLDIVSRLDLELDPPIALSAVLIDQREEPAEIPFNPQTNARFDLGPRSAEHQGKRPAFAFGKQVPASHFQSG